MIPLQDDRESPDQFEEEEEEKIDSNENNYFEPPENHCEIFIS